MDMLDLLFHPVRLRIVWAMSGGRVSTASDLCETLPDVPRTTVYRHIRQLTGAGLLEIADEKPVRGVLERYYRLRQDRTMVDEDTAKSMSLDDHRRAFTAAMAALHAEFNAYLDRPGAGPVDDSVGYKQDTFWLNPDELTEMITDLRAVFRARWHNRPAPGRHPHLMAAVFFPAEERARHTDPPNGGTPSDTQHP